MMTHALRATMAANGGLLTWAQARDHGVTSTQLRHLIRTRRLVPLRRGLYVDGELWDALDPHREQHRLRTRAVILGLKRGFVVSHDSSAHEHGLEILLPQFPHTHITRRGSTTAWTRYGVKHHYAGFRPEQVMLIDGLEVLDIARTAVDMAREHGEPYGEIACDAAMRHGVTRDQLRAACEPMANWPYIHRTRSAVEFADPGAQTVIETLGRLLVDELSIGAVETQFPMRDDNGRVIWCDMRVGRHIFETHGKVKFLSPEEGGVADRPASEVAWRAQKRDRWLRQEGLGCSHIYWEDYWPDRRAATLKRLADEYADTVSRFGDRLPERLERQAREIRGTLGA
jgi:hypothetical protein